MTTPTIFKPDQGTPAADTSVKVTADSGDSSLAILVGEGRKYKTVEDLAKATLHLDDFAEKLKTENAEMRTKLASAKTVDDVLQRIQQSDASTRDQGADKAPQGLTAEAVGKLVRETVTGMETSRTRQENLLKADAEMKKLFGDKAGEMFAARATNPQTKAALQTLAEVSPEQFIQLFKPATQAGSGSQTDSGTQINSAALETSNASGRVVDQGCKEFYDNLRRTKPSAYYSQAVQLQMNKVAVSNPDKFFGKK